MGSTQPWLADSCCASHAGTVPSMPGPAALTLRHGRGWVALALGLLLSLVGAFGLLGEGTV